MDRNSQFLPQSILPYVALRKESVDRNLLVAGSLITLGGVALRKESVDRNREIFGISHSAVSRSPQGERG